MRHPILAEAISLLDEAIASDIYTHSAVEILKSRRAQLDRRSQDNRIFVAFIGEKKAGKTALVRALTQVPLPTAVRECTAAVCEIQVGKTLHHQAIFSNGTDQAFEATDDSQQRHQLQDQHRKDSEAAKAAAKQIVMAEKTARQTETKLKTQHQAIEQLERDIGAHQRELRSARGGQPWLLPWLKPFKWLNAGLTARFDSIELLESQLVEAADSHTRQRLELESLNTALDQQHTEVQNKWETARHLAAKYSQAIAETEAEIAQIQSDNTQRFAGDLSMFIDVQKNPAERIQIQSPNIDIPDNLVILDTPGLNTDRPDHRRRAWAAIEELADVCILVSDLRQPMPDTLMDMLDRLIPYCPNLHVALTKRDLARQDANELSDSPDTEVAEAIMMAKARIADRWPNPLQVWSVASIKPLDQEDVRTKFRAFWSKLSPELRVQKHALLASAILAEVADLLAPQIEDLQHQVSELNTQQLKLEAEAMPSLKAQITEIHDPFGPLLKRLKLDIRSQIRSPESQWLEELEKLNSKPAVEEYLQGMKEKIKSHAQDIERWLRQELNLGVQKRAQDIWDGESPLNDAELSRLHNEICEFKSQSEEAQASDNSWLWTASSAAAAAAIGTFLTGGLTLPLLLAAGTGGIAKLILAPIAEAKHKAQAEIDAGLTQLETFFLGLLNDIDASLSEQLIALLRAATRTELQKRFEALKAPHRSEKKRLMSFQRRLWNVRTRLLQPYSNQTGSVSAALPPPAKEAK